MFDIEHKLERVHEQRLVDGIKALAKERRIKLYCWKLTVPGFTGVPDRLILLPGGEAVFVELKRAGQTERKRQDLVQDRIRALGFTVFSSVGSAAIVDGVIQYCREYIEHLEEVRRGV